MKQKLNLPRMLSVDGRATMDPDLKLFLERLYKIIQSPEALFLFAVCFDSFEQIFSAELDEGAADRTGVDVVLKPTKGLAMFVTALGAGKSS